VLNYVSEDPLCLESKRRKIPFGSSSCSLKKHRSLTLCMKRQHFQLKCTDILSDVQLPNDGTVFERGVDGASHLLILPWTPS
ncbi:Hypothetical protein FKW44_005249, partial [Caligus rogercresseyi]